MESYNYAFFADSHLGYSYTTAVDGTGVNLRVRDGYAALHEIVSQVIESDIPIHGVIHGGDLFHTSTPSMRDIATAQHYLRLLSKHDIPFYGLAGNHDASDDRSMLPSVAVVDDPDRKIHALWKPYQKYEIADGILLHSVAHHGLAENAPEIEPDPSSINIFTTHGAALDPKNATLMNCMDSPREQIIPPELVLSDLFAVRLLGHYHSRYPVGGEELNTWYAGSSLRRGFSDAPGPRGWLLVQVFPDGSTKITARDIFQRPQYDFTTIDALDLTGEEVQERILANIRSTVNEGDDKTKSLDLVNAPILRQRVVNTTRAKREGVDRAFLAMEAKHALKWQLEFMRPDTRVLTPSETTEPHSHDAPEEQVEESPSLRNTAIIDLGSQYLSWAHNSKTIAGLLPEQRPRVGEEAHRHIKDAEESEF